MLETMLHHLEVGYMGNANPYHNNLHACDVLQTTHYFISQTGLSVNKNVFYIKALIDFAFWYLVKQKFVLISHLFLRIELDVRFRNLYLIDCGHHSRFWPYRNNKQFSYQLWKWFGLIVQRPCGVGKSSCICFL